MLRLIFTLMFWPFVIMFYVAGLLLKMLFWFLVILGALF